MFADVRYSLRTFLRTPGFAIVTILVLALGIGANTAIFSVVNAALIRPLPYDHPERLVSLAETRRGGHSMNVAGPNFGPDSSPALCMPGASISAYHAWGLGVPNFSVIPLNKFCNANLSAVAESISHEMVEILSDPAGFGYIHETGPIGRTWPGDFIPDLGSGELGDICENGGPKNPGKDENIATMPFGPFRVSRYWSNVDNSCQPEFIMNRTWFTATGSPLVRFTGSVHDFSRPVAAPPADASAVIQQLMVLITTGGDNLNGGNGPNDNADAIITLKSGRTIPIRNINSGRGWGNKFLAATFARMCVRGTGKHRIRGRPSSRRERDW